MTGPLTSVIRNVHPSSAKHSVAIALGSNLGDRFANIETALRLIEQPDQLLTDVAANTVSVVDTSFMYETAPMYVTDQPRFANCACLVSSSIQELMATGLLLS
jgi:dihydroneopterin aldolase / 2-amino-4-hydroxy-6-hydroxymethyldihydropteridine diphosphokinase / dihydropteroate synthase